MAWQHYYFSMELSKLKLVTIIADESLEHVIEEEIIALGAKGYTVSQVEGKGKTGSRNNAWSGKNVKIETIVAEEACEQILKHIAQHFFKNYALIVYTQDVQVMRSSHFV